MATRQELMTETATIQQDSETLSRTINTVSEDLINDMTIITPYVDGSQNGMEAMQSLQISSQTLVDASAAMQSLSKASADFLEYLKV